MLLQLAVAVGLSETGAVAASTASSSSSVKGRAGLSETGARRVTRTEFLCFIQTHQIQSTSLHKDFVLLISRCFQTLLCSTIIRITTIITHGVAGINTGLVLLFSLGPPKERKP